MNADFRKLLTIWNNGILRGAQRKFAARIGVKEATVSHWVNGSFTPDETLRPKIAAELNISLESFNACCLSGAGAPRAHEGDNTHNSRCIPVVGVIDSRIFTFNADTAPDELLPLSYQSASRVVALKVTTSSLAPHAAKGEYAIIALSSTPEKRGLAVVEQAGGCTITTGTAKNSVFRGSVKYFLRKP
ncbi:MAG TPA: helix-turn-helix transcriptional regulator [Elusimicrobiales bacterium]|nr:helix-turn-helix transcriptional regulator [Elusimicrobiales bacterium]